MRDFRNKIIWITGASSGIGREMSLQCNGMGATVILSSRREKELEVLQQQLKYPDHSLVVPLDMQKQESFPIVIDKVIAKYGRIDLLFNNAGISQRSSLESTSIEVDRQLMEVNFFGPVALTKTLLPYLQKQDSAHIAVTSSLAGKFGFYERSAYSASKHALQGFFETLALEQEQIKVTIFYPGGVKTSISRNALDEKGRAYGKMSALQEKGMDVGECVKQMIQAIRRNKREVIIAEGLQKMAVKVKALFPGLFFKMIKKQKPQ